MIVALVRKTSVLCWMLVFSGTVISCSVPGHNSLTDSQNQPREGREKTEAAEDADKAVRTTGELIDEAKAVIEQASQGSGLVQAIPVLKRFHAELRSRAEEGDVQAQGIVVGWPRRLAELRSDATLHVLILVSLITSDEQLQMATWRCFASSDYFRATALFTLVRVRSGSEDLFGEVSVAGVTHLAEFQVAGLDRRWDFGYNEGRGTYRYAFVIEPDGSGLYYDFSISEDGRAKASDVYECRLSP